MKVALLQPKTTNPSGQHSYLGNLSKSLKEEGVEVLDISMSYLEFLNAQNIIPDVDLIHNASSFYYTKGKFNKPSVMTIFDTIPWDHPEWMTWKSNLYHKIFGKRCWNAYDHIITISENSKKDLLKHNVKDITVVYPGVDEIFFKPYEKEKTKEIYTLYVGGFDPRKNIIWLINKHLERNENFKLVLAGGSGWKTKEVLKKIEENKERITFIKNPDIETLYDLYHNCSCFMYPSLYEGFGLPLAEAMACGCRIWYRRGSCLGEVKPYHWKDQVKEIINVYERLL